MASRIILILTTVVAVCAVTLVSCDEKAGAAVHPVRIKGKLFHLEVAATDDVRMKGLGGRDYIAPDGGMIFVFARAQPLGFVMRDCPIPIDIAYLDGAGRVVSMHEMEPEPPRREDETDFQYEARLPQYPSRFPAQFAVEVAGGRLKELGVEVGDKFEFDARELKRMLQ